jgi:hypothetical protein
MPKRTRPKLILVSGAQKQSAGSDSSGGSRRNTLLYERLVALLDQEQCPELLTNLADEIGEQPYYFEVVSTVGEYVFRQTGLRLCFMGSRFSDISVNIDQNDEQKRCVLRHSRLAIEGLLELTKQTPIDGNLVLFLR